MRFIIITLCLNMIASSNNSYGCVISYEDLIKIEKNYSTRSMDLSIPYISNAAKPTVTQSNFEFIATRAQEIFEPLFKDIGYEFIIETYWFHIYNNAHAITSGKRKSVKLYGGLARRVTNGAFLYTVCHEIGHHLGGFPRKSDWLWASTEGQSDYYANLKCMRRLLKEDTDIKALLDDGNSLPNSIKNRCKSAYTSNTDQSICLKSIQAALDSNESYLNYLIEENLTDILNGIEGISLNKPSNLVVSTTEQNHLDPQCSLDTGLQASLCNSVHLDTPIGIENELEGVCHKKNGDSFGYRPRCWFKPSL